MKCSVGILEIQIVLPAKLRRPKKNALRNKKEFQDILLSCLPGTLKYVASTGYDLGVVEICWSGALEYTLLVDISMYL
jgi:hypothetical protein